MRQYRQSTISVGLGLLGLGVLIAGWLGWRWASQPIRYLLAVDAKTGLISWVEPLGDGNTTIGEPMVANYRVLVATASEPDVKPASYFQTYSLLAFDATSGQRLWAFTPTPSQWSNYYAWLMADMSLFGDAKNAYFFAINDQPPARLVSLNIATGQLQWSIERPWVPNSRDLGVITVGDRLVVTSLSATPKQATLTLQGRDPETARTQWQVIRNNLSIHTKGQIENSDHFLLADEQNILLTIEDSDYQATTDVYDINTGQLKRTINLHDSSRSQRFLNSTFYNLGGHLQAFDVTTGLTRWTLENALDTSCQNRESFEIRDQSIYIFCSVLVNSDSPELVTSQGWLLALDARTGQQRWFKEVQSESGWHGNTTLVANSEAVFVIQVDESQGYTNYLTALSNRDGQVLWRIPVSYELSRQTLAVVGDRIVTTGIAPRWWNGLFKVNRQWAMELWSYHKSISSSVGQSLAWHESTWVQSCAWQRNGTGYPCR